MTQRSLDKISTSAKGQAGGVCPLDDSGKVSERYLPNSVVGSTGNYATLNSSGKISLDVVPQGSGSKLDADSVDGVQATDLARSAIEVVCQYPLQGGGTLAESMTIGLAEDVLNERFDHTKLLNVGTNTHEQIDEFVALATDSPTAGAIPIADVSGKLNAWVDIPTIEGFFELDANGDMEPVENPSNSTMWELDGNGDIEPLEAI